MLQNFTEERRQYKRVRFTESIYFQAIGTHRVETAVACDFCEGGLRLNANTFLPMDTPLAMQVPLASGKICDCLGCVVWVRRGAPGEGYQTGVKFIDNHNFLTARQDSSQDVLENAEENVSS